MSDDVISLFKGFSTLDRFTVQQFFPRRTFAAGEAICRFGDQGEEMFAILSGRAEVRRPLRREDEFEVVATLETGQVIGEASIVGQFQRNATVVALDEVSVLAVTRAEMARFKKEHPDLAFALYESLIELILVRFRSVSNKKDLLKFWLG